MVGTDLSHGACAALPPQVATVFCSCREPQREPAASDLILTKPMLQLSPPLSRAPLLLQVRHLLRLSTRIWARRPGTWGMLFMLPLMQPRIQSKPSIWRGYRPSRWCMRPPGAVSGSGARMTACAKAAAFESGSGSGPSRRPNSSCQKKAKAMAVVGLLQLPLLHTPSPLTREKQRQIAQVCDLNAPAILDQVRNREASACLIW